MTTSSERRQERWPPVRRIEDEPSGEISVHIKHPGHSVRRGVGVHRLQEGAVPF